MSRASIGPMLIFAGGALALVGVLVWSGALSWFGKLPGDIRIERPHARVYLPIVSMLLVSAVLSLLAAIVKRLR